MSRSMLATVIAAVLVSAPVHAEDQVGKIFGNIAKQYLGQEQDRAAFAQAQSQNTLAGYQAYLQQFPNGANAEQARGEVQRLGGSVAAPQDQVIREQAPQDQSAGANSSLSIRERATVQRRLTDLGYDTSGTDGTFGPGTRRAIALWQRDRNYTQTGTLTASQTDELLRGTSGTSGTRAAGTIDDGPSQVEAGLGLSRRERSAIQAGLTRRGFDTRGVDGSFGRGTRSAIAAWQRANDLTSTGYLTADEVQTLAGQ